MDTSGKITHHREKLDRSRYQCTWVLDDFKSDLIESSEWGLTPSSFTGTFGTYENNKCEWILRMSLYEQGDQYLSLCLSIKNLNKDNFDDLFFVVRFSIVDNENKKHSIKSTLLTNENLGQNIFKKFIRKPTLLNNFELLPNGKLTIVCDIFADTSDTHEETHFSKKFQANKLGKILNSEKYNDFKFIVGEKEFNVHRAILAVESPVFEAMFDSEMRESNESKVEIIDVEADVMEKLLHFVYVGELTNAEDLADKLLIAAEKYQLEELKHLCEDVLIKQLNLTNVYDILCLADENMAENLKKNTLEFFRRNAKSLGAHKGFKACISTLPGHLKTDIIDVLVNKI